MSFKQKIAWHIKFRRSPHWNENFSSLRMALLEKPGVGEINFRKILDGLKKEHGSCFSYIPQWPLFSVHQDHCQAFFIDFLLPKFRLCIEIDGPNHQETLQESWDDWRSDFIRTEGFFVVRYDWKTVIDKPDTIKHDLLKHIGRTVPFGREVSAQALQTMTTAYAKVSLMLTPVKYKGKRKGKRKARLNLIWTKCKKCSEKSFHINDGVSKDHYCRKCTAILNVRQDD